MSSVNSKLMTEIIDGRAADPFTVLGAHPVSASAPEKGSYFRAFLPGAEEVWAELPSNYGPDRRLKLEKIHPAGFFEGLCHKAYGFEPYRLKAAFKNGRSSVFHDAYSFRPVLSDFDLFLWNQGNNYRVYEHLGAQLINHQGVQGVCFSVWAPSAQRVSVVGDFNYWDGRRLNLRSRGPSGVWELFVPHVKNGALYKYEILTQNGQLLIKSDPFAFFMEQRPQTASIVWDMGGFTWTDQPWLQRRARTNPLTQPMSIYEVHLGSWRKKRDWSWLSYREAAQELVAYVKEMGFNWIEFLPLAEHPLDASWGYQVGGYYAATSRFGSPQDLMYLINCCHEENIGVIIDWVPAHFPKDAYSLGYFDGSHLYEHADPRQGEHRDWGTLIFNYGRNEVKNFLVANALFWLDKYHVDALRVDAVASMLYLDYSRQDGEWIPNRYGGRENLEALEFVKTLNTKVYELFPGAITIAEESTAWPAVSRPVHLGGLGFMLKWNMGWMHDMLDFFEHDPIYRRYNMERLTFAMLYAFHENFCLPLSHDEVVHGKRSLWDKMPGDYWRKCANLRLLLGYMYAEPGKKLLFMGGEFGQIEEWNHDGQLNWALLKDPRHQGIADFVKDLNQLYKSQPAMYENDFDHSGFEWIDFRDAEATVVSFVRKAKDPQDELTFVFNFTPVPRLNYRMGVNRPGYYKEMLNSDAGCYGGSGLGLAGGRATEYLEAHGRPQSVSLILPPLGMLILKRTTDGQF